MSNAPEQPRLGSLAHQSGPHRSIKRVASSAGEGATDVHMVHEYLASLQADLPIGVQAAGS